MESDILAVILGWCLTAACLGWIFTFLHFKAEMARLEVEIAKGRLVENLLKIQLDCRNNKLATTHNTAEDQDAAPAKGADQP